LLCGSDGSIRWFGSEYEKDRQHAAALAAAAAAPKTAVKAADGGGKGKDGAKNKGSPKGKGKSKKSSKKAEGADPSEETFESPFEGLWIVPGGSAVASMDTVSLSGDYVLVAGAEDGRVYLWAFARKSSGGLCFGRSSSTPHYVFQVTARLRMQLEPTPIFPINKNSFRIRGSAAADCTPSRGRYAPFHLCNILAHCTRIVCSF
jgi:hypothetical protein